MPAVVAVVVEEEEGVPSVAGAMVTGIVLGPESPDGSLTVASPLGYPCWSPVVAACISANVLPLAPVPNDEDELLSGSSSILISGCGGCITGTGTGTAAGVDGAF